MGARGLTQEQVETFTWADFIHLEEDDLRELIDGKLLEIDVPTESHEYIVSYLGHLLWAWAKDRQAGRVLSSGYKIRISANRGVMPDLQFYRAENRSAQDQQAGLESGRPDLVVEVISPTSRRYDRVVKLDWYASIGVPEYWIVDPEDRTLERLLLRDGHYRIAEALRDAAIFTPDSFPGLEIGLSDLWRPTA